MKASEMTIEEAINHAEEVAQRKCDECGSQHRQLANWLKELVVLRSKMKVAEDALGESKVAVCTICDQKHMCGLGTDKFDPCCIRKDIDNALAANREEGGAK